MNKLVPQEGGVDKIPALLVSRVDGFELSTEYNEMRKYELDIPGVVCSAFARFLVRTHAEANSKSEASRKAIITAHEALELLATSGLTSVEHLVTDEIFENFECDPVLLGQIVASLKPNARSLYLRWINQKGE